MTHYRQPVIYHATATFYPLESPQMLGDCRHTHKEDTLNICDAHLDLVLPA